MPVLECCQRGGQLVPVLAREAPHWGSRVRVRVCIPRPPRPPGCLTGIPLSPSSHRGPGSYWQHEIEASRTDCRLLPACSCPCSQWPGLLVHGHWWCLVGPEPRGGVPGTWRRRWGWALRRSLSLGARRHSHAGAGPASRWVPPRGCRHGIEAAAARSFAWRSSWSL